MYPVRFGRRSVIGVTVAVVSLIAVALVVVLAGGKSSHRRSGAHASAPTSAGVSVSSPTPPTAAVVAPSPSPRASKHLKPIGRTGSADVYAAAVAKALWNVDYRRTSRASVLAFWQGELATTLPSGTPAGTTIKQAQDAAMSTLSAYLPSAQMWNVLASNRTVSSFTVTGVSEPTSWVSAIQNGQITDAGLTARSVLGVQTLAYGLGKAKRTTRQSQTLLVAMLCPPSDAACRIEVFPPRTTSGTSG